MVSRPQMVLVLLRSLIFARPDLGNPRTGSTGSYSTSLIRRVTSRRRKTPKNTCSVRSICSRKRNARKSHLDGPPAMAKRWRATAESPIRLRRDQRRAEAVGALVLTDGRRRVRAAEADEYRWHGRGVILIRMHHHCAPVVAPQVGF